MWINSETGTTFTSHHEIRRSLKNVSLPTVITDGVLAMVGIYPIIIEETPAFDLATQTCDPGEISVVNGEWVQGWVIADKTAEAIAGEQQEYVLKVAKASTEAIQAMLDAECQKHEYDTINNAAGWAAHFADAAALADWGAACWAKSKQMRDELLAGTRTLPSVEEVLAEMPAFPGVNI